MKVYNNSVSSGHAQIKTQPILLAKLCCHKKELVPISNCDQLAIILITLAGNQIVSLGTLDSLSNLITKTLVSKQIWSV